MPGETLASRCDFLAPGTRYEGTQKVPTNREDAWIVTVNIQGYEPERGYICGSMEAHNLPTSEDHVVTFWEGQVCTLCPNRVNRSRSSTTATTVSTQGSGTPPKTKISSTGANSFHFEQSKIQ
eukprot:TRINITY_DN3315_c0_g1_i8.p1 TRINITY_DN3315_c0_g1~~TRINITY_DN3315_c0_g1_i8.p1  ORF type:complete len:123 (-),score=2.27 TRINITY_DN3315_c0_g1_i8:464-832(-)